MRPRLPRGIHALAEQPHQLVVDAVDGGAQLGPSGRRLESGLGILLGHDSPAEWQSGLRALARVDPG